MEVWCLEILLSSMSECIDQYNAIDRYQSLLEINIYRPIVFSTYSHIDTNKEDWHFFSLFLSIFFSSAVSLF